METKRKTGYGKGRKAMERKERLWKRKVGKIKEENEKI